MAIVAAMIEGHDAATACSMALSGAQSALAGTHFIFKANGALTPGITDIAPYAAFGAFYFLVSAVWLTLAQARKGTTERTA